MTDHATGSVSETLPSGQPSRPAPSSSYAMGLIAALWLACALALFRWAFASPGAPWGEVSTQQQIDQAHLRLVVTGVIAVGLPAVGFVVALVRRSNGWAMLQAGAALTSLLIVRVLWGIVG